MNNPYDYPINVAIKFVVLRDEMVLVLREPETNEWMPGRLGLPGGKLLLGETISEAVARKIKTEVGFEIEVEGLVKVIDILMSQRTVYHFILLARHTNGEINLEKVEAADMSWLGKGQVGELTHDHFTEYYNQSLLQDALNGKLQPVPLEVFQEQDNRSGTVMEWMRKGVQ